jgi:hypothetical protein
MTNEQHPVAGQSDEVQVVDQSSQIDPACTVAERQAQDAAPPTDDVWPAGHDGPRAIAVQVQYAANEPRTIAIQVQDPMADGPQAIAASDDMRAAGHPTTEAEFIQRLKQSELSPNELAVLERDKVLWKHLGSGGQLDDWIRLYEGLAIRRKFAMRIAFTNEPKGKRYALCRD